MAKRKLSATVDVGLRLKEPMRAALEKSAKRSGISMNAEIVGRLDRSLYDDKRLSGPGAKRICDLMAMTFSTAGTIISRNNTDPDVDWLDDAWIDQERAFYYAASFVAEALVEMGPGESYDIRRARFMAAVKGRLNKRRMPEVVDRPSVVDGPDDEDDDL